MTTDDLIPTRLPALALACNSLVTGVTLQTDLPHTDITINDTEMSTDYATTIVLMSAVKSITINDATNGQPKLTGVTLTTLCSTVALNIYSGGSVLSTLAFAGLATLTSFTFNGTGPGSLGSVDFNGCALDRTSIDAILSVVGATSNTGGTLNLSGGTNAVPSPEDAGAPAVWTITGQAGSSYNSGTGGDSFFCTRTPAAGPVFESNFGIWLNVNGTCNNPGGNSPLYEVDISSDGSPSDTLAAIVGVIGGLGLAISIETSGDLITITDHILGSGAAGSTGGNFVGGLLSDGTNHIPNAAIAALQNRGWAVTTN